MGIFEFDQELHDKALLEDGEEIGMEKGIEIGKELGREMVFRVLKELRAGNTDTGRIARSCGCTIEEAEGIRKQLDIL